MNCKRKVCNCYNGWVHYETGLTPYKGIAYYIKACTICHTFTSNGQAKIAACQDNKMWHGWGGTYHKDAYITPLNYAGEYRNGFHWNNIVGLKDFDVE